jgi:hypothetical protein
MCGQKVTPMEGFLCTANQIPKMPLRMSEHA